MAILIYSRNILDSDILSIAIRLGIGYPIDIVETPQVTAACISYITGVGHTLLDRALLGVFAITELQKVQSQIDALKNIAESAAEIKLQNTKL